MIADININGTAEQREREGVVYCVVCEGELRGNFNRGWLGGVDRRWIWHSRVPGGTKYPHCEKCFLDGKWESDHKNPFCDLPPQHSERNLRVGDYILRHKDDMQRDAIVVDDDNGKAVGRIFKYWRLPCYTIFYRAGTETCCELPDYENREWIPHQTEKDALRDLQNWLAKQ